MAITWEAFQKYLREKLSYGRKKSYFVSSEESMEQENSSHEYSLQNMSEPIFSIPEEVLLNIFSYLPAQDLVVCSEVCRLWYRVSSDRILWEHTLSLESKTWQSVKSGTYWPDEEAANNDQKPALHPKVTYLCCTQVTKPFSPGYVHSMAQIWRKFSRKKAKLMMVGPGLESWRTRRFVHRMVHDKCVEFEPVGMQPGVNGFGTGITFKLNINEELHNFDLITLYSHRAQDRGVFKSQESRMRTSFLFTPIGEEEPIERLAASVQVSSLCETIDGIIFIIDSEENSSELDFARQELQIFLAAFPTVSTQSSAGDNSCTSATALKKPVPILVLSLLKSAEENKRNLSALQVARGLGLFGLPNPWYVQDAVIKDMSGIGRGILWIVQKWLST